MKNKNFVFAPIFLLAFSAFADKWTSGWVLDQGLKNPESVLVAGDFLYISNVNGGPTDVDGNGYISKIGADGKPIQMEWGKGLNAPKGMAIAGDTLWTTDISELVGVNLTTGQVSVRIPIAGAKFLNDVAVSHNGQVFFSDMVTGKVHALMDPKTVETMAQVEHPNGLFVNGSDLFVATWGSNLQPDFSTTKPGEILKISLKTKKSQPVSKRFGALDGLCWSKKLGYVVSDWKLGKVFHLKKDNADPVEIISGLKSAADIGCSGTELIYVPDMNDNKLYQFKKTRS